MDSVTLTISRDDAECLIAVLNGRADYLKEVDPESWDRMRRVFEAAEAATA